MATEFEKFITLCMEINNFQLFLLMTHFSLQTDNIFLRLFYFFLWHFSPDIPQSLVQVIESGRLSHLLYSLIFYDWLRIFSFLHALFLLLLHFWPEPGGLFSQSNSLKECEVLPRAILTSSQLFIFYFLIFLMWNSNTIQYRNKLGGGYQALYTQEKSMEYKTHSGIHRE